MGDSGQVMLADIDARLQAIHRGEMRIIYFWTALPFAITGALYLLALAQ